MRLFLSSTVHCSSGVVLDLQKIFDKDKVNKPPDTVSSVWHLKKWNNQPHQRCLFWVSLMTPNSQISPPTETSIQSNCSVAETVFPAADEDDEMNRSSNSIHQAVVAYGYRETPFTWDELKEIIATEQFERLYRNYQQQYDYEAFRRKIKDTWRSVLDFILCPKETVSGEIRHPRRPDERFVPPHCIFVPHHFSEILR